MKRSPWPPCGALLASAGQLVAPTGLLVVTLRGYWCPLGPKLQKGTKIEPKWKPKRNPVWVICWLTGIKSDVVCCFCFLSHFLTGFGSPLGRQMLLKVCKRQSELMSPFFVQLLFFYDSGFRFESIWVPFRVICVCFVSYLFHRFPGPPGDLNGGCRMPEHGG